MALTSIEIAITNDAHIHSKTRYMNMRLTFCNSATLGEG
jgi:hypothetical protein